jgi:threonine dehydrogenase-like Zn-dependent dehydrogenase
VTYKAAVLTRPGAFEIRDLAIPAVDAGEVLVRVRAVNVCPTDIKKWKDGTLADMLAATPLILGHEIAGEVITVGPAVTQVAPGDRVAIDPVIRGIDGAGREVLTGIGSAAGAVQANAELLRDRGIGGGFAELVKVPVESVIAIPDALSFAAASLVEPLADVMYSLAVADPLSGRRCGVFGLGPMGLLHVQALKHAGAHVVGVDPREDRRTAALEFGAAEGVAPGKTGELDRAFIVAGGPPLATAAEEALRVLRPDGVVVLFASGPTGATLPLDLNRLHYKRQRIAGVVGFRAVHAKSAIEILLAGAIDVVRIRHPLIPLSDLGRGFAETGVPGTFKFAIDLPAAAGG